ncbi:beta-lactamase family protein [Streptomyces tubbatahanensis]|uniref:Beta-lactamase family protein n=1 Tax=Streptomyces tubbatahanensis TaxID=2923272 RepID=A0ABY3Y1T0_9ACTN|nr:serine hydrolase domain-containing protein [Streptomyces tubbatahanensis]UNT00488.1 beta-lactamase family protein [Streptomyces tubbatahanensis]
MTEPRETTSLPSHHPCEELLPATRRALSHRLATAQAQGRAPSLAAAVTRGGELVWAGARSGAGEDGPDENTQYRVGSITKTFTAVLVMRLRDEGVLALSDPLERHLPGTGVGHVTLAQLLSHTGGLAAETPGPWWERSPATLRPELSDVLGDQPLKHPTGHRHHYSNPGYTLLGSLVEAVRRAPWHEVLRQEVLTPLGLHRTGPRPEEPYARGWAVHPWADALQAEPAQDLGLMAAAGQLWSTTADLARFAGFLLRGDERVLCAASVREMRVPYAPAAAGDWGRTYGLGLALTRQHGRSLYGHSGSLPGYLAALWSCEEEDLSAVVLANCTSGPAVETVAADLVRTVADAEPLFPEPWRPLPEVDPALLAVAGPWYWGTQVIGVRLRAGGALELGPLSGAGRRSLFRPEDDGTWTGLEGYYAGERLEAVRRPDGSVSHLDLGSFVFTRAPYDPQAPVPGGVDPHGWRGASQL